MSAEFQDIKLVKLIGAKQRNKVGEGSALRDFEFRLSASAPAEWAQYFNKAWEQHFYLMKRSAKVSGNRLTIFCMDHELEDDHIPELNKVIGATNTAYQAFHSKLQQAAAAEEVSMAAEKESLEKLKKNINKKLADD